MASLVHLIINAACLGGVGIVTFRGKDQIVCKLGVAKESLDALDDVAVMELEAFTSNGKFFTLKLRGARQFLVDDIVKFLARPVR